MVGLLGQMLFEAYRLLKVKRLKVLEIIVCFKASDSLGHRINGGFMLPFGLLQKDQIFALDSLVVGVVFLHFLHSFPQITV